MSREAVSDARLIRSVNREISVYSQYDEFLKLAHNPDMRFVFSNTTEAGISYHAGISLTMRQLSAIRPN